MPAIAPPKVASGIRRSRGYLILAIPGLLTLVMGLGAMFDTDGSERGVEQSLGIVILIFSAILLTIALILWLLRPAFCKTCGAKLPRHSPSCPSCGVQFI